MRKSYILEQGNRLLTQHEELKEKLLAIPKSRKLTFRIELEGEKTIGKPRFKNRYHVWDPDLLAILRDHLENVWIFFDTYSYWMDDTIMPILSYKSRRESNLSIIFLLETDVWETSVVFGDYLIEKRIQHTNISYYRFNRRFKTKQILSTNDKEIEQFIKRDAVKQIQDQFNYLWSKIESEIKTCIKESHQKQPQLFLDSVYLQEQLEKTIEIVEDWPEAALLSLGRIVDMWILMTLDRPNGQYGEDLVKEAELQDIITKQEFKLLKKIKHEYNNLKHKRYYYCKKERVNNLVSKFQAYIKDNKR